MNVVYGTGINRLGEIIELGVKQGIVEKSGAWYSYKSDRIGQGRKKSAEFLEANPAIAEEIESTIRAQLLPDRDADPGNSDTGKEAPETEVDAATASAIDVELPARSSAPSSAASGPSSAASGPSSAEGTA